MISRPKKPSKYSKQKLLALLNVSEERLRSIQDAVNDAADWHLEAKIPVHLQESHKWKQFTNEVVTSFPDLKNYQDYWPLYGFLSIWRNRNRSSEKKLGIQRPAILPLPDIPPSKNHTMFIGKPLPRRIRFQKHRNIPGSLVTDPAQIAPIVDFPTSQKEPSRITSEATASRRGTGRAGSHQNSGETVLSLRPRPASLAIMETGSTRSESNTLNNAGQVNSSLFACLFCDYVPNSLFASRPAIAAVFQDRKHVIDSLSTLGICSDRQLHVLMDLRMWGFGPDRFFDSIPANELSPLYKTYVLWQLRAKQGLIPRPPLAIEANLTMGKLKRSPVWKIFGPANRDRCLEFIKMVDEQVEKSKPQSLLDLRGKIRSAFPFISDYKEDWPLLFHLKWKDQLEFKGSTSFSTEAPNDKADHFESVNSSDILWTACPTHSPTHGWDYAPTKLRNLLRLFRMEELTPIFLMAHVKTNEDFDLLHVLGEEERNFVFERLELPHVRRFQRWMLAFLLKNIDILD